MTDHPAGVEDREQRDEPLVTSLDNGVLTLTLNRPEKRNALDERTVRALTSALVDADSDADVRVILLRGSGTDFCAGADLAAMERMAGEADPMANLQDAQRLGELLVLMRRHSRPIIGAVHGHALAGGAGLATACDLVLAREDAIFGYPEVRLGFVPAMVMAILRRTVGEKVAFEIVARGESFDARRAAELGLINRVIPALEWDDAVTRYAVELARGSSSALTLIKRLFSGMDGLSFEEAIARGAEVNALARLTPDTREGVRKFLDRSR
jgi:methylglutaconyl-CoA hydratase